MYTITETTEGELQFIELANSIDKSKATICLNQGGRLSDFIFEDIRILADYDNASYKDNYASSILFPFANRIKDGTYTFNKEVFQLVCNEEDKNNALHGLVYNKHFEFSKKNISKNEASVVLTYNDLGTSPGFPFKFCIQLTYTLSKTGISLSVNIENKDHNEFPFSLGWHPYFVSRDLDNSALHFKSNSKYLLDKQQIIIGSTPNNIDMPFQLKDAKLDDGYHLDTDNVDFFTPDYNLKMSSTPSSNFLQLYTPNQPNIIAIEPMTGAANNFNNKIGLDTLEPNKTYKIEWNITIKTSTHKTE